MASKPRSLSFLYENAPLTQAREPFNIVHFLGGLAKFSLAIGAVGSAAVGTYQTFATTPTKAEPPAMKREAKAKEERTFFQALIDADREALKNHDMTQNTVLSKMWPQPGASGSVTASDADSDAGVAKKMRAYFTAGGRETNAGVRTSWQLAFLKAGANQPVVTAPANPPVIPQPSPAYVAPVRPQTVATIPVQPAAPAPQRGFAETRPVVKAEPDKSAAQTPRGFVEVHRGGPALPQRPDIDDIEFTNAVFAIAEKDFQALQRAVAVAEEFARRYPQAVESAQFRERAASIAARNARTVEERSTLKPDTPAAPVLFNETARGNMVSCLSGVPGIAQVAAVNRPVSHDRDRLAFLVSVTIALSTDSSAATRVAEVEQARKTLPAQIGPCLSPLLQAGSVALAVSDGQDSDVTRQRIDMTPGALIYRAANAPLARSPKPNADYEPTASHMTASGGRN